MPDKYGTNERATLIALMLAGRAVPNAELRNEYGIELKPAGRAKLNEAKLIHTTEDGRRYTHRLTGAGRKWCVKELAGIEAPPRTGPLVRVVFELVWRFVAASRQRGIRLIEVTHPGDLEALIREIYQDLSVKPQDWVRLARIRAELDGAGKDEVDEVLLKMVRTGTVHLSPDSNRKVLTAADHAAAVRLGSEENHLLAIEES